MVSLPDPNQFLGATTKPVQANLSGAEVASPYAEMARSFDKGGEALNAYAIEEAKKAGEAAGAKARIDDNNNVIIDKAPFYMGPASPEYRRAATMTAAMRLEPQIQNKALELREAHRFDAPGFQKAWDNYQTQLGAQIDDQHLKIGIGNIASTTGAQTFRTLLTEANTKNIADFVKTTQATLTGINDQTTSIARQEGGLDPFDPSKSSDEYKRKSDSRKELYDTMENDARIAMPHDERVELEKAAIDNDKAQALIGQAQRLPGADILEKKQWLYNKVWGPDGDKLRFSPRQRDAVVAEGIKSMNILDARDREEIADHRRGVNKWVGDVIHRPELYSEDVRQSLMARSVKLGDPTTLHLLQQAPLYKDVIKYTNSQPSAMQAGIIDDFVLRGILPNGMPIGVTAPVRPAQPNVDPAALSQQGFLGIPPSSPQQHLDTLFHPEEFPQAATRAPLSRDFETAEPFGITTRQLGAGPGPGPRAQTHGGLAPSFVEAIKRREGFEPIAKWDFQQYSSGYGTRAAPGERIDRETAEKRLSTELTSAASIVDKVNPNLDPGTRAALTSLTHNAGSAWTTGTLGQKIRAGDIEGAKQPFLAYIKAGGAPLRALQERRAEEVSWFGATQAAPGPPAAVGGGGGVGQAGVVRRVNVDDTHFANLFMTTAEEMRKMADHNATTANTVIEDKINKGLNLAPGEAEDYAHQAYTSGSQEAIEKMTRVLTSAEAKGQVPPAESVAIRKQAEAAMQGMTGAPYLITKRLVEGLQANEELLATDPIQYAAVNKNTPPKQPINVENPSAALGQLGVRQGSAAVLQQDVKGPIPLIGKDEAHGIGGQLTGGDPAAAAQFLGGLHALATQDEGNYFATVEALAPAIVSMSHNNDAVRMGAGFDAMNAAWVTNPVMTRQIFKDEIDRMLKYRVLKDYLPADALVQHMNIPLDPKVREDRIKEAKKKINLDASPEETAYQLGTSLQSVGKEALGFGIFSTPEFIGRMRFNPFASMASTPAVPPEGISQRAFGGPGPDALASEYNTLLTEFVADGMPLEQAKSVTLEKMKSVWRPSEVGGNVIMKHAPELYYDQLDGSYDWMKEHLLEVMTQQLGEQSTFLGQAEGPGAVKRNWTYVGLVADQRTDMEARARMLPSYKIAYKDDKGLLQAMPNRINWDKEPAGPQLEHNAPEGAFGAAQARALARARARQTDIEYRARQQGIRSVQ